MSELQLSSYPDVLKPKEAIRVLRIGRNKFYELVKDKKVGSIWVGSKLLIPNLAVQKVMEEGIPE